MGTRKNDMNKWALGHKSTRGKLRQMGIAIDVYGYWGLMSTWRKKATGQMSTGGNEHCGQIGTLAQMDPGRDGDRENLF